MFKKMPSTPLLFGDPENVSSTASEKLILVVDDDDFSRNLVTLALKKFNFSPIGAPNTTEALRIALEYRNQLRLVVTDFNMPGGNGDQLILDLAANGIQVPTIVMSGYPLSHPQFESFSGFVTEDSFLEKPFELAHLKSLVMNKLGVK